MREIDRLRMLWVEAVWKRDYILARKITDAIQHCIDNDSLLQELWPGAIMLEAPIAEYHHE